MTTSAPHPHGATRSEPDPADSYAVASFVSGLTGLLVFNLLLGPLALVLAALAVRDGTGRRARAFAGALLGLADLVVLAVLVTADGTVSWGIAS